MRLAFRQRALQTVILAACVVFSSAVSPAVFNAPSAAFAAEHDQLLVAVHHLGGSVSLATEQRYPQVSSGDSKTAVLVRPIQVVSTGHTPSLSIHQDAYPLPVFGCSFSHPRAPPISFPI